MKALLKRYAERIDAATLRERVIIFLAAALVVVFAVNAALLGPLRAKQRRIAAEAAQHERELRTLQAELQRLAGSGKEDPDAASRSRQIALRGELERLSARIGQEQRRFTPAERMRVVLQEMLQRHRRLSLVDLRTVPAVTLGEAQRGPAGGGAGLYRHGIELSVSGSYADLYEYLRALERLPTQLYWGRAELAVTQHPLMTLKLTVYTVSFDDAWLIV